MFDLENLLFKDTFIVMKCITKKGNVFFLKVKCMRCEKEKIVTKKNLEKTLSRIRFVNDKIYKNLYFCAKCASIARLSNKHEQRRQKEQFAKVDKTKSFDWAKDKSKFKISLVKALKTKREKYNDCIFSQEGIKGIINSNLLRQKEVQKQVDLLKLQVSSLEIKIFENTLIFRKLISQTLFINCKTNIEFLWPITVDVLTNKQKFKIFKTIYLKNKQRRVKKGFIYFEVLNKTIRFDSILELSFIFFKEGKLERCKERFQYENNGEVHFYQPDFVIEDQKIEIKSKKEFDMNNIYYFFKSIILQSNNYHRRTNTSCIL